MNRLKVKIILVVLLSVTGVMRAFAQDDVTTGKVVDSVSGKQIGTAEIIIASNDFGFYVKMWLNGTKLRIIRPTSGSRSTSLNCSFREYKVNPDNPKDESGWEETGSGTATLQTPVDSSGDVRKMPGSMTFTERIVGDNEVKVTEKPQKFEIIIK
jgi:hypothetical protein